MTTRHEAELREIERMMRNPGKSEKVTPAMMEHVRVQRQAEKDRDARTRTLGTEINLSWAEGEPKKWDNALAVVEIGGQMRAFMVEPHEEVDGKTRLKPKIVTRGYKGLVEDWALWKWHTDRGSEVDDNGHYILDCEPPTFVWAEVKAPEPVAEKPARAKPGPKPKVEA
jgi:hypothetical protein